MKISIILFIVIFTFIIFLLFLRSDHDPSSAGLLPMVKAVLGMSDSNNGETCEDLSKKVSASLTEDRYAGGAVGTILRSDIPHDITNKLDKHTTKATLDNITLPKCFDLRKKYPDRMSIPLQQASCGSCWAFATTSTLSDRFRILTNTHLYRHMDYTDVALKKTYTILSQLSPYFLAACDFCTINPSLYKLIVDQGSCNNKCDGGVIQYAYIYIHQNGIISTQCNPEAQFKYECHSVEDLASHYVDPLNPKHECHLFKIMEPYQVNMYENEELYDPIDLDDNTKAIQSEIYRNGTVTAGFKVYQSFYNFFKTNPMGIYTGPSSNDKLVGGHAICIVGWGVYGDVKYWIVRNSWGINWGDGGYFRIEMGKNVCDIESDVWAARPDRAWLEKINKSFGLGKL